MKEVSMFFISNPFYIFKLILFLELCYVFLIDLKYIIRYNCIKAANTVNTHDTYEKQKNTFEKRMVVDKNKIGGME